MKRFFLLALAIVLVACSGPVGKDDFWVDTRVGSNRTLVVLLPTIGGDTAAIVAVSARRIRGPREAN